MSASAMNEMKRTGLRCAAGDVVLWVLLLLLPLFIVVSNSRASAFEQKEPVALTEYLSLGAKVKYLFKSHTSYEFGNPFPPYQAPLSRLEFPLDSWWGGLEMKLNLSRLSLGMEALTNVSQNAHGEMEDSDWDDDTRPDVKTIYSQSQMRVGPSYMVRADADLEVSDWLGLPKWLSIRPVTGIRWQRFNLVAHDGVQYSYPSGDPPLPLPGESIRFKQEYWQYFIGVRSDIDLTKLTGIASLRFLAQFDWAYVEGNNEDNHLLRAGRRFTYENTYGHAWHGSVGLKKDLSEHLTLGFDVDYLAISTTGNHRLLNETFGVDMSFTHGVKVWSDQASACLTLEYRF